jgi:hypothetical protein
MLAAATLKQTRHSRVLSAPRCRCPGEDAGWRAGVQVNLPAGAYVHIEAPAATRGQRKEPPVPDADGRTRRRPYWVEFPGAEQGHDPYTRNHKAIDLERALQDARTAVWRVKRSDGSPANDADVAVITNRDTGYRWILRRGSAAVEFQMPGMLAEQVAGDQLDVFLSVEEAEALAAAAESVEVADKRKAAVLRQAAGQLRLLAGQVREARRRADTCIDRHAGLRRDERARLKKQLAAAERTSTSCARHSPGCRTARSGSDTPRDSVRGNLGVVPSRVNGRVRARHHGVAGLVEVAGDGQRYQARCT